MLKSWHPLNSAHLPGGEKIGYIVKEILQDHDLCAALSDIFVDNDVDYKYIASVASYFPLCKVKVYFFEWVAPVCHTNLFTPVPSVWCGFNKDELWAAVCEYQRKKRFIGQLWHKINVLFLRVIYKKEWAMLESETLKRLSQGNNPP